MCSLECSASVHDNIVAHLIHTLGSTSEGEHHHQGTDDKHAGDYGHTYGDTVLTSVQQGVQHTHEQASVLLLLLSVLRETNVGQYLSARIVRHCRGVLVLVVGEHLQGEALHQACGNDTTEDSTAQTNEWCQEIALAYHKDQHQQAHAEGCAEIYQRHVLVLLEVACKALVLTEGNDCRIVTEESEYRRQRSHTGHIEHGAHDGTQKALQQVHHSELHENLAQSTGYHAHAHQVEHGVEQQVVCRVHNGVEHVGKSHHTAHISKQGNDDEQAWNAVRNLFKHIF